MKANKSRKVFEGKVDRTRNLKAGDVVTLTSIATLKPFKAKIVKVTKYCVFLRNEGKPNSSYTGGDGYSLHISEVSIGLVAACMVF